MLLLGESAAGACCLLRAPVPDRWGDALDRLIASHAMSARSVLITNNLSVFAEDPGLRVVNWLVG